MALIVAPFFWVAPASDWIHPSAVMITSGWCTAGG